MTLKEKLKIILREFHRSTLPDLVSRHLSIDFSILGRTVNKVITIVGPRRAGKTYFLFQIMKDLMAAGASMQDFIYVNFEDERLLPMRTEELQSILDAWAELYGEAGKPVLFLDEVQNISGWERFVRRLNDRGLAVLITGSNSKMLGKEIATELRGRTASYEIFPFSFPEYLASKGIIIDPTAVYDDMRHRIQHRYETFLHDGGYPEIAFIDNDQTRIRVFQDYFNAVFHRDLVERYQVKSTDLLRQWMNTLMANIASLISYNKVENDFKSRGMKLSRSTLSAFAAYIEDCYFGFFVEMHDESIRKRQINPKKFYLIDQGLHNYLTLKFSENRGRLLENMVFLELRRKGLPVRYFKTAGGQEVDFLVKNGDKTGLIQVCHDLSRIDAYHREKTALMAAMRQTGVDHGLILTWDEHRDEDTAEGWVAIRPVWRWLLDSGCVF